MELAGKIAAGAAVVVADLTSPSRTGTLTPATGSPSQSLLKMIPPLCFPSAFSKDKRRTALLSLMSHRFLPFSRKIRNCGIRNFGAACGGYLNQSHEVGHLIRIKIPNSSKT